MPSQTKYHMSRKLFCPFICQADDEDDSDDDDKVSLLSQQCKSPPGHLAPRQGVVR
jgi:hypothetical protein